MRRLIWAFVAHICHKQVFSCRGLFPLIPQEEYAFSSSFSLSHQTLEWPHALVHCGSTACFHVGRGWRPQLSSLNWIPSALTIQRQDGGGLGHCSGRVTRRSQELQKSNLKPVKQSVRTQSSSLTYRSASFTLRHFYNNLRKFSGDDTFIIVLIMRAS